MATANTFVQIGSTVTAGVLGATTIDFSSIPSTYTDLVLICSTRQVSADSMFFMRFNNDSGANYANRSLWGEGSFTASFSNSANSNGCYLFPASDQSTDTASVFGSSVTYIPNYADSQYKSVSTDQITENNGAGGGLGLMASLWSSTSAINRITLTPIGATFVQYSTASLYGILKY